MIKILKVNRTRYIDVDNIEKFVIKPTCVWVYRKVGYPKVYKTTESFSMLKKRLTNLYLTLNDFKVEYDNDK